MTAGVGDQGPGMAGWVATQIIKNLAAALMMTSWLPCNGAAAAAAARAGQAAARRQSRLPALCRWMEQSKPMAHPQADAVPNRAAAPEAAC